MKCPEGPLACDMFSSSSPSSTEVGNRNRIGESQSSSPRLYQHTPLFCPPPQPLTVADVTHVRARVCGVFGGWMGGGIVIVSIILFFFQSVFRPLFFLIKTSALDRVFVCAKKDNYCHYFQSYICTRRVYIDVAPM